MNPVFTFRAYYLKEHQRHLMEVGSDEYHMTCITFKHYSPDDTRNILRSPKFHELPDDVEIVGLKIERLSKEKIKPEKIETRINPFTKKEITVHPSIALIMTTELEEDLKQCQVPMLVELTTAKIYENVSLLNQLNNNNILPSDLKELYGFKKMLKKK